MQKAMAERIYWIVSTYLNVKRVYHGILEGYGQSQKIIGCTRLFFLTMFCPRYLKCLPCCEICSQ